MKNGDLRLSTLRGQLTARLRPVLRDRDFDEFDLDRAISTVLQMAELLPKAECRESPGRCG